MSKDKYGKRKPILPFNVSIRAKKGNMTINGEEGQRLYFDGEDVAYNVDKEGQSKIEDISAERSDMRIRSLSDITETIGSAGKKSAKSEEKSAKSSIRLIFDKIFYYFLPRKDRQYIEGVRKNPKEYSTFTWPNPRQK